MTVPELYWLEYYISSLWIDFAIVFIAGVYLLQERRGIEWMPGLGASVGLSTVPLVFLFSGFWEHSNWFFLALGIGFYTFCASWIPMGLCLVVCHYITEGLNGRKIT